MVVKPLVDEAITTITLICPGASMLFCRAALPLSAQILSYVAGVIRRHGAKIGLVAAQAERGPAFHPRPGTVLEGWPT